MDKECLSFFNEDKNTNKRPLYTNPGVATGMKPVLLEETFYPEIIAFKMSLAQIVVAAIFSESIIMLQVVLSSLFQLPSS